MEAVRRMLAGTGLEVVKTGENSITIRRPAGQSAQDLQEVVVTGSRIKRAGFDTLEAAIVTSSKQISRRGYSNVLEALQATPGFGNPGSSALDDEQGRLGIAQSFANFFSLGSQRTLTLVNGRRFVSSNTVAGGGGSNAAPGSQVDLNLIPVNLIDHIETVAIGGAPVYGADAIAGTVNIILKDHFQGVEATGQYGESGRGDAQNRMFSVLLGGNFDQDRGNAVLSVDYTKQNPLVSSARFGRTQLVPNPADTSRDDGIPAQIFNQNTRLDFLTEGGLPYDGSALDLPGLHFPGLYPNGNYIFNASGQPLRFDRNGSLVPMNFGAIGQSVDLGGGASVPLYANGGDGVNAADHFGLLAGTQRILLNALGHYDVAPNTRLFVNASYAHTEGVLPSDLTSIIAPNIVNSPSLSFSVDNPFLSQQAHDTIVANGLTTFNLARNLNDIVDMNPAKAIEDVYRVVAGFEGTFHAFGEEMSWNAAYDYGNSRTTSSDNYIDPTRLLLAADAVRDPSGNIACASGDPCVPIDLFGEGAFSRQAADYVLDNALGVGINTEEDVTANLSGALPLSLGRADQIKFNIGYERRTETGSFQPDSALQAGDQLDGVPGFTAISGEYHTNEVYGETVVPLISDGEGLRAVKSAQLEGAVRNVDNSVAGRGVTWSAGGRFAPRMNGWGDGMLVRGVFTHSIRDPAITELFLPSAGVLFGITDPCDATNVEAGPNPAVRLANCTKGLAAVGGPAPQAFNSTTNAISVAGIQSGNPHLTNEIADSWSVGFVYQPSLSPHFRFSADWSSISLKGGIQALDINQILGSCYDSSNYPNNPACSLFSRLTASQLNGPRTVGDIAAGFQASYINTATTDFDGLISVAQYQRGLGRLGSIDLSATLFYIHRFDQVDFAGQPVTHEAGTVGMPRYDVQLNLGYSLHRFDTEWQVLWKSASVLDTTATLEDLPDFTVPSYALLNATVGYQFTDRVRAQLVVNNVLDKKLPLVALEANAFGVYDPIGRMFLLSVVADL
jgi:outer membrane receptor protein involved in Fe transport